MPKKRTTYVPPFLDIAFASEGTLLWNCRVQHPVQPTATNMLAHMKLHADAKPYLICATLLESMAAMNGIDRTCSEAMKAMASYCITAGTPMAEFQEPMADWPF